MLASSSDHHIFDKLGYRSKEEAVDKYLKPILTACEYGITPRVHLEDTTRADIEGWVIPLIQIVLGAAEGRSKFRVCDTIGWGMPDPHVAMPQGIPQLISILSRETGAELEFHGHNDFGLATANSLAPWRYGCPRVNVTFAELGDWQELFDCLGQWTSQSDRRVDSRQGDPQCLCRQRFPAWAANSMRI